MWQLGDCLGRDRIGGLKVCVPPGRQRITPIDAVTKVDLRLVGLGRLANA